MAKMEVMEKDKQKGQAKRRVDREGDIPSPAQNANEVRDSQLVNWTLTRGLDAVSGRASINTRNRWEYNPALSSLWATCECHWWHILVALPNKNNRTHPPPPCQPNLPIFSLQLSSSVKKYLALMFNVETKDQSSRDLGEKVSFRPKLYSECTWLGLCFFLHGSVCEEWMKLRKLKNIIWPNSSRTFHSSYIFAFFLIRSQKLQSLKGVQSMDKFLFLVQNLVSYPSPALCKLEVKESLVTRLDKLNILTQILIWRKLGIRFQQAIAITNIHFKIAWWVKRVVWNMVVCCPALGPWC